VKVFHLRSREIGDWHANFTLSRAT
jgi:hypothetical protein